MKVNMHYLAKGVYLKEGGIVLDKNNIDIKDVWFHPSRNNDKVNYDGRSLSKFSLWYLTDGGYKIKELYKNGGYRVLEICLLKVNSEVYNLHSKGKPIIMLVIDNIEINILDLYGLEYYIEHSKRVIGDYYSIYIDIVDKRLKDIVKVFRGNLDLLEYYFSCSQYSNIEIVSKEAEYLNFKFFVNKDRSTGCYYENGVKLTTEEHYFRVKTFD